MFGFKHLFTEGMFQPLRLAVSVLVLFALSACAHHSGDAGQSSKENWVLQVEDYRNQLSIEQTKEIDALLGISDEMRQQVLTRFSNLSKHSAAKRLTKWLIDESGHNMRYDVTANLTPIEAYQQRRGNCLSFTLLLNALADELGIDIEFNSVDIPNTWGLDEKLGMVFYRHVNGTLTTTGRRQIFDLAMNIYDTGYPQRYITRDQALALHLNNKAVDLLGQGEIQQALHPLKLAISLSPENPDLWANLGVVMKRSGKLKRAESAFTQALKLDRYSIPAASNLERHYREQGNADKAKVFEKQVARARKSNPYYHYQLAQEEYRSQQYRGALRATNRAISLHNQDPRFYELKSRISQQQHNYHSALKSLKKAYALSIGSEQRDKYAGKAILVSQQASAEAAKRWQEQNRMGTLRQLQNRY